MLYDEVVPIVRKIHDRGVFKRNVVEQLLSQFEHQALFAVIGEYMNHPSIDRLEWIICLSVLCEIDPVQANRRFIKELQTDDADRRFRIVKLLRGYGTPEIVPTLVTMLKDDPEPGIRFMVAIALGDIGDESVLPALKWSLENDHGEDHEGTPISYVAEEAIKEIESRHT